MAIYFDNAATTYPKPEGVYRAQDLYFRQAANPGRGAHALALESARAVFETRLLLARFLGVVNAERLIFTGGCTQALNMAIKGMGWRHNDLVVTSPLEHNSVMRPLKQLEQSHGISVKPLPYASSGVVDLEELERCLAELRPRVVVVAEASNVTGELVDLPAVAGICRHYQVPLLVDAAQSAGFVESRIEELGISMWCASGHKGLMGPPGVGVLYVSSNVDLEPLIAGGTGSRSEDLEMPPAYPDKLEAGTLPGPAIVALGAGVSWLEATGLTNVREHETALADRFLTWAADCRQLHVYGAGRGARRTGIVAFQVRDVTADRVADVLDRDCGIAVRSGLHCASLAHRALGTIETGLVRASFGYFNTLYEVDELCRALENIIGSKL